MINGSFPAVSFLSLPPSPFLITSTHVWVQQDFSSQWWVELGLTGIGCLLLTPVFCLCSKWIHEITFLAHISVERWEPLLHTVSFHCPLVFSCTRQQTDFFTIVGVSIKMWLKDLTKLVYVAPERDTITKSSHGKISLRQFWLSVACALHSDFSPWILWILICSVWLLTITDWWMSICTTSMWRWTTPCDLTPDFDFSSCYERARIQIRLLRQVGGLSK